MMNKLMIASAVAGVLALSGALSVANAGPMLSIVDGSGPGIQVTKADPTQPWASANPATNPNVGEVTGDAGGSVYPWPGGPGAGAGVPSDIAGSGPGGVGWPTTGPGFAPDPSFGNALGTTGFHSSYLWLSESANVKFEFMGAGTSDLANSFWLNPTMTATSAGTWIQLFQDGQSSNPTNPCPVTPNGATAPSCDILTGGFPVQNEYTACINVAAGGGYVPFAFDIDGGTPSVINDGVNNPDPHDPTLNLPGYFLGVDPYLATGQFQTSGKAVYAGLSDRPSLVDHDFQDMGVRISVPEPGSLALLSAGLIGFGALRRRRAL